MTARFRRSFKVEDGGTQPHREHRSKGGRREDPSGWKIKRYKLRKMRLRQHEQEHLL